MLTLGVDLGKRQSPFCALDENGGVVVEPRLPNRDERVVDRASFDRLLSMKYAAPLLLALLLLPAGAPAPGGTIIWARSADSSTLDPAEIEWGEDAKISQNLFEPLVTFKDDSVDLEGRLAKRW